MRPGNIGLGGTKDRLGVTKKENKKITEDSNPLRPASEACTLTTTPSRLQTER